MTKFGHFSWHAFLYFPCWNRFVPETPFTYIRYPSSHCRQIIVHLHIFKESPANHEHEPSPQQRHICVQEKIFPFVSAYLVWILSLCYIAWHRTYAENRLQIWKKGIVIVVGSITRSTTNSAWRQRKSHHQPTKTEKELFPNTILEVRCCGSQSPAF